MIVDIFVLIVVLASVIIAFLRGFIREVLTIFGIAGGIAASYALSPLLIPSMQGWIGASDDPDAEKLLGIISYPLLADILSYGAILIAFVIILSIISHFIAEFAKNLGLGALDRTLGVVFGLARAVFVLGLMYLPFFYLAGDEQKDEWFKDSKTQIYLEMSSSFIDGFIPKQAADNAVSAVETVKEVSETRKKLEDMDLLKRGSDDKAEPKKDGYSPAFRKDMDRLFEHNADKSPSYNE